MILYPLIEIKDGKCVRMVRGNADDAYVVNEDVLAQVHTFQKAGFQWLHIIDLDGVAAGDVVHTDLLKDILRSTRARVQFGGGLRTPQRVADMLDMGVAQVVLSSLPQTNFERARDICRSFPDRVVLSVDGRGDYVVQPGWGKVTPIKVMDMALRFEAAGAAAIIYTDIDRDGALTGLNVDKAVDLAWALSVPVIAKGGVSSLDDLQEINKESDSGIAGVILGSSLYDGRVDPRAALRLVSPELTTL